MKLFAAGLLPHWLHGGDALPVAEVSGQAGAASGGESKGCDLQIYMNWN